MQSRQSTWRPNLALATLLLAFAAQTAMAESQHETRDADAASQHQNQARDFAYDFKIWNRERNAHACMMSIAFIVLYPLGAISLHLPIEQIPYLKNTYLRHKVTAIHAPIQVIALAMTIGAMGLGIKIAGFAGLLRNPVQYHVVIGLVTVNLILLVQPAMGMLQHRHFKKTGGKSVFAYLHRWVGRCAILLGMINSIFGFRLAKLNVIVPNSSYVRSYTLMGILLFIWIAVVVIDEVMLRRRSSKSANQAEKGPVRQA